MINFQLTILELIAKGDPLQDVTDHICRHIEARFPGVICSILTVDRTGVLHPLSAPSLPAAYSQSLDNLVIGPNVGSCGTAAYTGKPVEVTDIVSDPRWTPFAVFQEAALSLGLRACWSSPLADATGIVFATFALYFREARSPFEEEREMVSICLHLCDLAFARHQRVADRERRANTDALTGLPNQGSFARALTHLNCNEPGSWALLLIDLDNLKMVNDTFGHAAGDRLLQEVASRLLGFVIPDGAFRTGGDEFAVVIKDPARLQDLAKTANSILAALDWPIDYEHFSITPEATIGVAVVEGNESTSETVRRNADLALYHAKENNRGSFVRYRSGIDTRIVARFSSIESLDLALKEGRIEAWYQPIVRMEDRRIVGLEALCRMVSPTGAILPARFFVEAMVDPRISATLTRRMLSLVADDMRSWHGFGIGFGYVSVNVTAVDLRGGRLQMLLDELFAHDRTLFEYLVLEMSETVALDSHDHVVFDTVRSLQNIGIRIALDDFGTGYASLTHLLDLPVDIIKIDRSFIARLAAGHVSGTIISGLIAVAHKLGASVTAEGVETASQTAQLQQLGCAFGQDFHFSRSVNRSETARLLMCHAASNPHGISIPLPKLRPRQKGVDTDGSEASRSSLKAS